MFGIKLRSWMEAVRPKKKQHRKEKQAKNNVSSSGPKITIKERADTFLRNEFKEPRRELTNSNAPREPNHPQSGSGVSNSGHSRYSANNLSSPESAYSTGYSTDGTSPGAPPEYLLNTYKHDERCQKLGPILNVQTTKSHKDTNGNSAASTTLVPPPSQLIQNHVAERQTPILKTRTLGEPKAVPVQNVEIFSGPASPGLGITSPRQRNRIRTNPWVPGSVPSPSPVKHVNSKENAASKPVKESPRLRRFLSPVITRRRSLSSSSCSSLSGTSLHLEPPRHSASDDDDCTLNEMMGKYDESYVYEKETDILSDSDPTDCETDIDTGQDGGDEDDLYEGELDFIDNGSYLECESRPDRNTGHCSYYNYDVHRKRSSRRRTTRKSSKQSSEKRRRSSSNKKRQPKQIQERDLTISHLDGSKSAGATPVSVRRAGYSPASRIALDVCLKKRSNSVSFYRDQHSNSVSFYRDHLSSIDRRDKEADIKYKELIFEADKLLRTMKTNGLSPRRLGPTNKRVELLRSTECSKPDVYVKNRSGINEDNVLFSKIPSNSYNSPRFSPKKSHITNFIMNNSPIMVKKEWEMQNQGFKSPLCSRKRNEENHQIQKGILHRDKNTDIVRMSPKHRRKFSRVRVVESSSESEDGFERKSRGSYTGCPQSEPVRRKVYFSSGGNMHKTHGNGKTVAFKLTNEMNDIVQSSTENLRQQVLLNTIVNLKKNLENQSASLKQVYSSSQNVYV